MTTAAAQPAAAAARALPRWRTGRYGCGGRGHSNPPAQRPRLKALPRERVEPGGSPVGEAPEGVMDLERMTTAELIGFLSKGRAERTKLAAATERHDHDVQSAVVAAAASSSRSSLGDEE